MASELYHIDVDYAQRHHYGYHCCGDVFLSRRMGKNGRVVGILSDGLGSGAIANVLGTLTASMALGFTLANQQTDRTARVIMDTLPADSLRRVSYATFTIASVERDGETQLVEFDNPPVLLIRRGESVGMLREMRKVDTHAAGDRQMYVSHFFLNAGDRLVMVSDGVTHSGMGRASMPFGYGREALADFVQEQIRIDGDISAHDLSAAVVKRAVLNDVLRPQDDITCGVLHLRVPRRLLICTGPPYTDGQDAELAAMVRDFDGRKIICGGTTSEIVARHLGLPVEVILGEDTDGLPPRSCMRGVNLVTEGVITLSRVEKILRTLSHGDGWVGKGPAWDIVRLVGQSDSILFVVGTRVNIAHYDPKLPIELEARRTLVRRVARLLEEKFNKLVEIKLI